MKKLIATIVVAVCAAFTASAAVNLGNLTKNTVVKDGAVIKGTLSNANVRVSIADGATVTIRDIEIQKTDKACAGLTCKGDATIILEGENKISACGDGFPGIFVPAGHTLTIKGFGKLDVNGEGYAAGIGGGENLDCGNIIIDGGTITAEGGYPYGGGQEFVGGTVINHIPIPGAGPGIGSGRNAKCGNIFFKRGNVMATGTEGNPGIGADSTGGSNALVKFYKRIGKVTAITWGANTFTYDHALFDSLPDSERWITDPTLTQKDSTHDYIDGTRRVSTITSPLGGLTGNKTFKEGSKDYWWHHAGVVGEGVKVPSSPVLQGELSGNHKISIAKDTTVILDSVTIGPSLTSGMPGITCNGNATIILKGENYVQGCGGSYPGIFVPKGCVLTIKGDGSLTAVGGGSAPGIGACNPNLIPVIIGAEGLSNYQGAGGQVKILSGNITAIGGENCAAIGVMFNTDEGMYQYGTQPEIYGGTVCAKGGIKLKGTTACWFSPAVESYLPEGVEPSNDVEYFHWNGNLNALPRGAFVYAVAESGVTISGRSEFKTIENQGDIEEIYCLPQIKIAEGAKVVLDSAVINNEEIKVRGNYHYDKQLIVALYRIYDLCKLVCGKVIRHLNGRLREVDDDDDEAVEGFIDEGFYFLNPGIICEGNAVITLKGDSKIKSSFSRVGIGVPSDKKLTIKGSGTLRVYSGYGAPTMGGDQFVPYDDYGNIEVESGSLRLYASDWKVIGSHIIQSGKGGTGKLIVSGGYVSGEGTYPGGIGGYDTLQEGIVVSPFMRLTTKEYYFSKYLGLYEKYYTFEVSWVGDLPDVDEGEEVGEEESAGEASPKQQMKLASALPKAAPRLGNSLELDTVETKYVAGDGTIIKGTLNGRHKICIAPDASVILRDASIWTGTMSDSSPFAGITCLGNATIRLEGDNSVSSFHRYFPAISVPTNCTLVIDGPGSLNAQGGNEGAAGIGGVYDSVCGSVIISNGVVRATGGGGGAGIGGGAGSGGKAGSISIFGGSVEATGGTYGAGIGSGEGGTCYKVAINGGEVVATGGTEAAGIGTGKNGAMNSISIGSGIAKVTAVSGGGDAEKIGRGVDGELDRISISAPPLTDTTSGNTRTIYWSGNLSAVHSFPADEIPELVAYDGTVISGTTLNTSSGVYRKCKISIAPGAHVKLNNATINTIGNAGVSDSTPWAGLTCLGDATIELLKNSVNEINTFNADYPGIYVPRGCKLTITGKGKLVANSQNAAGIGGGTGLPCGTISIQGGDVLGFNASGLAAGIGGGDGSRCDGVEIFAGITKVEAYSSDSSAAVQAQPVGAGKDGICYRVHIGEGVVEEDASTFATGHPFRRTFTSPYVDLSDLTDEIELKDGDIVTGTLSTNLKVTVKAGATIVLSNARIGGEFGTVLTANYPGIICKGNVKILLEGDNYVTGYNDYPAIWVVPGSTLTIDVRYGGDDWMGRLFATGGSVSAAIGAVGGQGATYWSEYAYRNCGYIKIDGGTVYAYGGGSAAGIGAGGWGGNGAQVRCGGVTINGGTVYAYGGSNAAGIGAGHGAGITPSQSGCGTITIGPGITKVVATKGSGTYTQTLPIGKSQTSSDVTVNIDSGLRSKVVDGVQTIVPDPDVDLSTLESFGDPVVVRDEATVSGTFGANRQVVIADGATVTLSDMTMDNSRSKGLACLGDATIILEGENFIRANVNGYAGLFVPEGHTLTIKGSGSLEVYGGGGEGAAGIGAGLSDDSSAAGDIVIEGGVIKAVGGFASAGIGASQTVSCGTIAILGGSVTAIGGEYANGIGAGWDTHCAGVTIENGIDYLSATCNGDDVNDCVPIGTLPDDASGVTVYGGLVEESSETPDPNDPDCFTRNRTFLPAELDLSKLPEDMTELTLQDGMTIKGTLGHACKVSIAPGAHIGLWEAKILGENNSSYSWAGLTCLGDATIRLRYGSSRICGFYDEYPGIYVPEGSTLTIEGTPGQQLIASSNGYAAGIGGGWYISCGSIVVNGGKVIARGWQSSSGNCGAGIGGGYNASCEGVVINGGDVTAYGGHYAAGIGSGDTGSCGGIAINGGTVRATGGGSAPGIGAGGDGSCGDIIIAAGISRVEATPGDGASSAIGAGNGAICGDVNVDESLDDQVDDALKRVIRAYEVVDLSTVTSDIVLNDMTIATGTLATPCKVSIAADARVRLRDVDINGAGEWTSYEWAGLTCLGDATIALDGSNTVKGLNVSFAGIYVPADTTLTIAGEGFLDVAAIHESGVTYGAAGIGGNGGTYYYNSSVRHAGNIVFAGGKVVAWGGNNSSAIGCSNMNNCGDITFEEGIISVMALNGGIGKVSAGGTEGTITIAPELERTGNYICHPWDGNLDTLDRDATARDGMVIYGTSVDYHKVYIAAGATVTLSDANSYGPLTCQGDATVILKGENVASISGAKDYMLTIKGDGSLLAGSENWPWTGGPGIGGGNIVIESGTIEARSFAQAVHAAAIGAGAAAEDSCGTITIGPGVTKVVATINKSTNYDMNAQPIGVGDYSSCGAITVDPSLSDVTSEWTDTSDYSSTTYITRTITRAPDAGVAAAYNAWATENGVSGAWNEADANGVANAFRYVFDRADAAFAGVVIIGFEADGEGAVAIQTLPIVNGKEFFTFTIVASDNPDGTGNVMEYPLSVDDPEGITVIEEEYNPNRFFRVKVDVK